MTAPSEDIPVTEVPADPGTPRLAVENLRIVMAPRRGRPETDVVDQVSFTVQPGHVLGLVGESGSGKTTVALALLGLVKRGLAIGGGQVLIDGQDILALSEHELQKLRGKTVAYVPQDPGSALNPVLKVGTQLHEVFAIHGGDAERLTQVMAEAGLEDPGPDPRLLPAPALRRPAAARGPGHGLRLPAAADRAGRADDRPRRHHPAPRPGHGARAVPDLPGRRRLHQPRPRRGGRDRRPRRGHVLRPADRDRRRQRAVRQPGAPLHPRAHAGHPVPGAVPPAAGHGRFPAPPG